MKTRWRSWFFVSRKYEQSDIRCIMDLMGKYRQKRELALMAMDRYFNGLPEGLSQQGRLLRNKLAIQFSETGEFAEILSKLDCYPILDIALWLLDDFGCPVGQERRGLETHLLQGSMFLFATVYTQNLILDEDVFFDLDYLPLGGLLSQQADRHFLKIFPADSVFWDHHRVLWNVYAEASLVSRENYSGGNTIVIPELLRQRADLLAPYQLTPIGAALACGRENDLNKLMTVLRQLHELQIILQDMENLKNDLQRGKLAFPMLYTYAELGVPLGREFNLESMLMAMALSGTLPKIAGECRRLVAVCLAGAREMGLEGMIAYFSALEENLSHRLEGFSRIGIPQAAPGDSKPEPILPEPGSSLDKRRLEKAILMAEGYLLSDLTFKESWEVHRWGMVDEAVVTSRFPAGLILEILCLQGHDLSNRVDDFFRYTSENEFSYYDHEQLPYADADTLAVLLGLYRYSEDQELNQQRLEVPLAWMRSSVGESGRIPVWIRGAQDVEVDENLPVRLLGEGCGSIEAKLLVGLCDYDWEAHQEIIQASAVLLLKRFIEQGHGITVNYPRLYCSWRIGQLLAALDEHPISDELKVCVEESKELYTQYLEQEANRYRITPQHAALLILASLGSPVEQRIDRRWLSILFSSQRSDGSWYGEPIFFVPNFGKYTTWHSSHQITSAICYQALRMYTTGIN